MLKRQLIYTYAKSNMLNICQTYVKSNNMLNPNIFGSLQLWLFWKNQNYFGINWNVFEMSHWAKIIWDFGIFLLDM